LSGVETTLRLLSDHSINIYPNPFNQTLSIEMEENIRNGEVKIYDLVGKEVLKQKLTDIKTTVNTSTLENGIYVLKVVSSEGNMFVGKVVKQ